MVACECCHSWRGPLRAGMDEPESRADRGVASARAQNWARWKSHDAGNNRGERGAVGGGWIDDENEDEDEDEDEEEGMRVSNAISGHSKPWLVLGEKRLWHVATQELEIVRSGSGSGAVFSSHFVKVVQAHNRCVHNVANVG